MSHLSTTPTTLVHEARDAATKLPQPVKCNATSPEQPEQQKQQQSGPPSEPKRGITTTTTTSPPITIRPRRSSDLPTLQRLLAAVHFSDGYPIDVPDPDLLTPQSGLAAWVAVLAGSSTPQAARHPLAELAVAENDTTSTTTTAAAAVQSMTPEHGDRIVGHALVLADDGHMGAVHACCPKGIDADRLAFLGRLFVDPDMRGRGVGRDLVQCAMEWASGRGRLLGDAATDGEDATVGGEAGLGDGEASTRARGTGGVGEEEHASREIGEKKDVGAWQNGHGTGNRTAPRRLVLDVIEKATAAIRMYEALGWERFGEDVHVDSFGRSWRMWLYMSPE